MICVAAKNLQSRSKTIYDFNLRDEKKCAPAGARVASVPEDEVVRARRDHVSVECSTLGIAALIAHARESEAVEYIGTVVVGFKWLLIWATQDLERRLTWVILHRDARDSQESPARDSRAVRERESLIRDYLPRHLNCVRLSIIFRRTNVHVPGAVPVRRCDSRIKLSILCKLPSAALLHPCSATTHSASSRKGRMYSGCVVRSKSAAVRVYYGNVKPGFGLTRDKWRRTHHRGIVDCSHIRSKDAQGESLRGALFSFCYVDKPRDEVVLHHP